jgi:hypothetical protein
MRAAMAVLVALIGCGTRVVELDPRDSMPDAGGEPPVTCVPGTTECTNCQDDDDDGFVDGFDIECTAAWDDDESGFGTETAGDGNVQRQDCFFDDNSGFDEGCDIHVCCELVECPADIPGPPFDPEADCVVSPECVDYCKPATPPGCDCFGCCTVCPQGNCIDIYIHPAIAPDCDDQTLADPVACPRCEQDPTCVQECGGATCVLCPGQTLADLPASCTGGPACPDGSTSCGGNADCAADEFCSGGCCVRVVE